MEDVYAAFYRYAGEIISKADPIKNEDTIKICEDLQKKCQEVEATV